MAKKPKAKTTSRQRSSSAKPAGTRTVVVTGPDSVHVFDAGWTLALASAAALRDHQIRQADIQFCTSLEKILLKGPPGPSWVKKFHRPTIYRICWKGQNPLDTAATFGAGGRCNLGMAQRCKEMPSLRASYGLYASLERQTALIEVGSALKLSASEVLHEITLTSGITLKLIDYDDAVQFLESAAGGLSRMVAETPFYSEWALQKHPKPSQIIGEWLRRGLMEQADGLVFTSTKNARGKNIFLFAEDATSLTSRFSAKIV